MSRRKIPCVALSFLLSLTLSSVAGADPPDCSEAPPLLAAAGSRYLQVTLPECSGEVAIRILGRGSVRCVDLYVRPDGRLGPLPFFQSHEQWGNTVYVRGAEIVPDATYTAQLEAPTGMISAESPPVTTWRYGKTDGTSPSGPSLDDLLRVLDGAAGSFDPLSSRYGVDLTGNGCCVPDRRVEQSDVDTVLDAIAGLPYPCPGFCCLVVEDFEAGSHGWVTSPQSTCDTGDFVFGTPVAMESLGVTTQVGGDHTTGTGNALFTAFNSSAGSDDVDRGTCILESPELEVSSDSEVSVWFFHGQRDAGDDPAGDFFRLEFSTDGGASWSLMETAPGIPASYDDVAVDAAWTRASASVPAGSEVKLRLRVSDGSGPGDIIEAGLDDLSICPSN